MAELSQFVGDMEPQSAWVLDVSPVMLLMIRRAPSSVKGTGSIGLPGCVVKNAKASTSL